jgi:hypothetical protein
MDNQPGFVAYVFVGLRPTLNPKGSTFPSLNPLGSTNRTFGLVSRSREFVMCTEIVKIFLKLDMSSAEIHRVYMFLITYNE